MGGGGPGPVIVLRSELYTLAPEIAGNQTELFDPVMSVPGE